VPKALGKESSANSTSSTVFLLSTFYRALSKVFAECHLVLGKEKPLSRRLVTETTPLSSVLGKEITFDGCLPVSKRNTANAQGREIVTLRMRVRLRRGAREPARVTPS
jgi:hypothetical protein